MNEKVSLFERDGKVVGLNVGDWKFVAMSYDPWSCYDSDGVPKCFDGDNCDNCELDEFCEPDNGVYEYCANSDKYFGIVYNYFREATEAEYKGVPECFEYEDSECQRTGGSTLCTLCKYQKISCYELMRNLTHEEFMKELERLEKYRNE